jgi:small multidrug resistance pump
MQGIHGAALIVALVLNASANLLMKIGMNKIERLGGLFKNGPAAAIVSVITSPVLVIGLICFAMNAAFYMFALQSKSMKISIAYPLMVGGGYAIIATIGYFFLNERLTTIQKVGVALILLGVVVVASQSLETQST